MNSNQLPPPSSYFLYPISPRLTSSKPLQPRRITIKHILIPRENTTVRKLPERIRRPTHRQRPSTTPIPIPSQHSPPSLSLYIHTPIPIQPKVKKNHKPRNHQWTLPSKPSIIPRTRLPPIRRRINHRPPARLPLIRIRKVPNPLHHTCLAEPIARTARLAGVILDVEHAGEGASICRPAAAVSEEVGGLGAAGGEGGLREVVAAADETGVGRAGVLGGEGGIGVGSSFGGLGGWG